ncbi:glycosyltransferase family 4 protein [Prosthecochloris sp. GSB1]|uniref:glycosyltransferase family 4 protein n=1 Tax=Prosthecochloris sp. GSB1 TaxID=281093 RepID=UPI00142D6AB1|nr:glycosyltransferase family 4 protein [Prosthecochloris sp. GSB1]
MRKEKTLYILLTSEFPPGKYGGIAYWASNLLSTLRSSGRDAVVLTRRNRTHEKLRLQSAEGTVYLRGHDWKKLRWLYRLPWLLYFLMTRRNVVLVAATWDELQVIHRLKALFGFRIYCSSHGTDVTRHVYPENIARKQNIRSVFSNVDLFLPVSRSLDRLARKEYGGLACGTVVLGCNVDTETFKPAEEPEIKQELRQKAGIPPESPVLISVGRMMAVKGYRTVIMTIPDILEHHPDFLYVIVSEPLDPERRLIEALVSRLNIEKNVMLLPPVPHEELPGLLCAADVFVLTSEPVYCPYYQEEGLPRVIVEASACGLPVIVSTTGGLPEAVIDGETGCVVETGDLRALKTKILELLGDRERAAKMGEKGRAFVRENFSDSAMAEKILSVTDN